MTSWPESYYAAAFTLVRARQGIKRIEDAKDITVASDLKPKWSYVVASFCGRP